MIPTKMTHLADGDLLSLEEAARAGAIDDIVIAAPSVGDRDMRRMVRRLSALPVSISIAPMSHWIDHRGGEITKLGDVNTLSLYRRPMEGWGSIVKTAEDYILGAIILAIFSPVIAVVALLVKLQDGGPVFFVQKRHGFNNAVFPYLQVSHNDGRRRWR